MITEVGPVEDALARVRAATGSADLRELIVLGAEAKLDADRRREGAEERRAELKRRLLERTTTPGEVDVEALEWVHQHGWVRDFDD